MQAAFFRVPLYRNLRGYVVDYPLGVPRRRYALSPAPVGIAPLTEIFRVDFPARSACQRKRMGVLLGWSIGNGWLMMLNPVMFNNIGEK